MSRIILHFGTHKTATTTLQNTFHTNRAHLERHGIIYPHTPPSTGHHIMAADWIDPILPKGHPFRMPKGGPTKMWQDIVKGHAGSDRTVFISAEAFSRGAPKRADMEAIRSLVEPFDEIEVVCVLRDQLSYLQSIYMQLAKTRMPIPFHKYFQESLETGMAQGVWIDFNGLYDHLLTGFPADEIRFLLFDDLKKHPEGVVGAMLDLIPDAPGSAELLPVNGGKSNVSPDPLACWIASRISTPGTNSPELMQMARGVLEEEFGQGCRTTIYTKDEIKRLMVHFPPLNETLENRVRKTQPEFSFPSLPPPGEVITRDMIKDPIWVRLARALYRKNDQAA